MLTNDSPESAVPSPRTADRNRLLRSLHASDYATLAPHLEQVTLARGDVLAERGDHIQYAYFPQRCVLSLVTPLSDGAIVESATVGHEGVVGLSTFLADGVAFERAIAQVPGLAVRVRADVLKTLATERGTVRGPLLRYTQALLRQTAQSVACLQHHPIDERCARWLLQTHDRIGEDSFSLTHEFLAAMLGVRRAGVTVALGSLQSAQLITYQRGRVAIIDRAGLEAAACECYRVITREYNRLLPLA
jgi:CRP-like cAMP-binding protein